MIIESAEYPRIGQTFRDGQYGRIRYLRTVRWVKQQDEKGCGIAALAMVLGQNLPVRALLLPQNRVWRRFPLPTAPLF